MSRKEVAHRFKVVFTPEPDGSAWNVSIPEVEGCFTYGRSLKEARANIRDCLGLFHEQLGPDAAKIGQTAELEEDIRLPADIQRAVRRYEKARVEAEAHAATLREMGLTTATTLTKKLSLRDAGELLGMSAEGVRKLAKPKPKPKREQRARG